MAWNDYVDGYCERVAPGLLGEPLNAASNLAFLAAAVVLWYGMRSTAASVRAPAASVRALPVLIALIFVGSMAFHTTATRWAGAADTGAIAVFLLYYVVFFARWFAGVRWRLAWLGVPAFVAFTAVTGLAVARFVGQGPALYLAALLGLVGFTAWLRWSGRQEVRPYWRWFAGAAAVFTVSLTLRSLDAAVCGGMPTGTHFLWHLLNAVTLYLVAWAGFLRWRRCAAVRGRGPQPEMSG